MNDFILIIIVLIQLGLGFLVAARLDVFARRLRRDRVTEYGPAPRVITIAAEKPDLIAPVADRVESCREVYPAMEVRYTEKSSDGILEGLRSGTVDIALVSYSGSTVTSGELECLPVSITDAGVCRTGREPAESICMLWKNSHNSMEAELLVNTLKESGLQSEFAS